MKKILLLLISLSVLASCKKEASVEQLLEEGNLEQIQKRRDKLQSELNQSKKDINLLNEKITELDPQDVEYSLVTAMYAKDTVFNHYVEVQGSVVTKNDKQIYPEMSGVMTRLYVNEGSYVKRGALIATVDDGGLKQQIAQQQVQLELARTTFERQKRLWDQNIGSEMQYLEAKNRVEALQKGIESMQQQLKKVNVYAPYSGSVEEVITKQGQVVSPGATPIIRLVGLGDLYVEAEVPERFLPTVTTGTSTIVELEAIDKEFSSKVRRVNSTINPSSRSFKVEVPVPNDWLIKPNLIANLKLNDYSNEDAILIPTDVINEDASGEQSVFVVDQLIDEVEEIYSIRRMVVELGKENDNGMVEVLSGLENNSKIIAEGAKSLIDGDEVKITSFENSQQEQNEDAS